MSTDYILGAFYQFLNDNEVHPVIFEAPEDQAIALKELIVLNSPFEFELVETGRALERFAGLRELAETKL